MSAWLSRNDGDAICCLTDHLQEPDERKTQHPVCVEFGPGATFDESNRLFGGIEYVAKSDLIVPNHREPWNSR